MSYGGGVISLSPQTVHPFLMLLFGGIVLRMPDAAVFQVVGQELLADEIAGIVVGVFIVGQVACLPHQFEGVVDGHVGGVALGTGGEVDGSLRQRDASFRPAYFHDGVEAGIGQQQGVGVCQSDVLGSGNDETAGYESGVFTASTMRASQ